MTLRQITALLPWVLAPGCHAGPDRPPPPAAGDGDTTDVAGTTGDAGDASDGTGGIGDACAPGHDHPGPSPLRRLTATQYNNALRDLFVGAEIPEQSIVVDAAPNGFENEASRQTPSALLVSQYQQAAVVAVAAGWPSIAGQLSCSADGGDDPAACGHAFIAAFGRRAFRRPLAPELLARYTAFFDERLAQDGFVPAVRVTIGAMLQAPQFIYLLELDDPERTADADGRIALDGYSIAQRLAFLLWNSVPDDALLDAAEAGELADAAGIEAQARRMLELAAARGSLVDFHRQWLGFDMLGHAIPDPATYPSFSPAMAEAMASELGRFVEYVVFEGDGRLSDLLTDHHAPIDGQLAELYGVAAPASAWSVTELDPHERPGVLTRAGWLTGRAHPVDPSPTLRGVAVMQRLLCVPPLTPPPGVDTTPPTGGEGEPASNRARYEQHARLPACAGCHAMIDGIGFGFENYDAIGRWRDHDGGVAVDANGTIAVGSDIDGPFAGPAELAEKLAGSSDVAACYVGAWFGYARGRPLGADDTCTHGHLVEAFAATDHDITELLIAIVTSDAFRERDSGDAP